MGSAAEARAALEWEAAADSGWGPEAAEAPAAAQDWGWVPAAAVEEGVWGSAAAAAAAGWD